VFVDIGFEFEDLQMIDNAYGCCFNLDTRGFDSSKSQIPFSITKLLYFKEHESRIAPMVLCPHELSDGASLYE